MIKAVRNNKLLFIPLIFSLLFFLRKGIQYAMINSYIPLLIIGWVLFSLSMAIRLNKNIFLHISRVWAITIMVWSIVRILISVVNYATNTFDEYHLSNQFGIYGISLSIVMFTIGMMIMMNSKAKRIKDW